MLKSFVVCLILLAQLKKLKWIFNSQTFHNRETEKPRTTKTTMPIISRNSVHAKQVLCEVVSNLRKHTLVKNMSDLKDVFHIMGIGLSMNGIATEEQDCDFDADMTIFLNKIKLFNILFRVFHVMYGIEDEVTLTALKEMFLWFGENILYFIERPVALKHMETYVTSGATTLRLLATKTKTRQMEEASKAVKTAQKCVVNYLSGVNSDLFAKLCQKLSYINRTNFTETFFDIDLAKGVSGLNMGDFILTLDE